MTKNILICDANHGGLILLDEYSKYTQNKLFFFDVYDKLDDKQKDELSIKYDVEFLNEEYIKENNNEFTVISPVHMKNVINSNYTHHEFTAYLLKKHKARYNWDFKIIEVTGVKGKTTTTSMIKDVLCEGNVLCLSSENASYISNGTERVLVEGLSITPSSIITVLNKALDEDILGDVDYCVLEVSLGIVPFCDVGILTNILEDYPIAGGTKCASIAKANVFESDYVICDKSSYDNYYSNIEHPNLTLVSLGDVDSDVYISKIEYAIDKTRFTVNYNNTSFDVSAFALSDFYVNNILFVIALMLKLDMPTDMIQKRIDRIKTVTGRGSIQRKYGRLILEDINPGLNTTSIKKCIKNLKRYTDNYLLIIGGDYGITCEEIDEEKLANYIKTIDSDIIFTGKLGCSLLNKLNKDYVYEEEVKSILNNKGIVEKYDIIQIIYRSQYSKSMNEVV